ncbi:unnamed protein product [Dovyalis caffra]|uniref:Uncharacterized protein n=1 Tax=Dovyalis caffra TaxID=77055 RepID=A0AAV1R7Y7_9ROSI|nr:unnamed protein product [Dovyalis caffra]
MDLLVSGHLVQSASLKATNEEKLLKECQPADCLVADSFFPWTNDAAAKFGIPTPKKVSLDSEFFVVPNLPGDIKLTRNKLPGSAKRADESDLKRMFVNIEEANLRSFGVVVNSFYELEPVYADHYRKLLGRKAWHVGPVSLCNRDIDDKAKRGREASINQHECLDWINSKKSNSVVYICFGSMTNFNSSQAKKIAEASRQQFTWVVRKTRNNQEEEDWLPEGFEKRMEGKGLITSGWAPQSEAIEKAATQLMESEEAVETRKKAKAFGEIARKAVEEGGSSASDLNALIEELRWRQESQKRE